MKVCSFTVDVTSISCSFDTFFPMEESSDDTHTLQWKLEELLISCEKEVESLLSCRDANQFAWDFARSDLDNPSHPFNRLVAAYQALIEKTTCDRVNVWSAICVKRPQTAFFLLQYFSCFADALFKRDFKAGFEQEDPICAFLRYLFQSSEILYLSQDVFITFGHLIVSSSRKEQLLTTIADELVSDSCVSVARYAMSLYLEMNSSLHDELSYSHFSTFIGLLLQPLFDRILFHVSHFVPGQSCNYLFHCFEIIKLAQVGRFSGERPGLGFLQERKSKIKRFVCEELFADPKDLFRFTSRGGASYLSNLYEMGLKAPLTHCSEVDDFRALLQEKLQINEANYEYLRFLDYACRDKNSRQEFYQAINRYSLFLFKLNRLECSAEEWRFLWLCLKTQISRRGLDTIFHDVSIGHPFWQYLQDDIRQMFQVKNFIYPWQMMRFSYGASVSFISKCSAAVVDEAKKFRYQLFYSSFNEVKTHELVRRLYIVLKGVNNGEVELCRCLTEVIGRSGPDATVLNEKMLLYRLLIELQENNKELFSFFIRYCLEESLDFIRCFCKRLVYRNCGLSIILMDYLQKVPGDRAAFFIHEIDQLPEVPEDDPAEEQNALSLFDEEVY